MHDIIEIPRQEIETRYRWLRVGEIMQTGDLLQVANGNFRTVGFGHVGHKVLGTRDGPDFVLRLRKRPLTAKTP